MANKPQDPKPQDGQASKEAPAADYVRTKQEVDASEAKRQAEAKPAETQSHEDAASPPAKSHPKVHRNEETEPIQNSSDEPVVEDEP